MRARSAIVTLGLGLSLGACGASPELVPPDDEPPPTETEPDASPSLDGSAPAPTDAGVATPDAPPAATDAASAADAGPPPWTPGESCASWRSWRPTWAGAPRTLIQPAAGLLDGLIVVHGGRQSVNTLSNVSGSTFAFTPPACADTPPNWTRLTVTGSPPLVWGAASTVAAHRLWVIGGTSSGAGACRRETWSFELTGPDTGAWTTLSTLLPEGLCHASAVTVEDETGKPWIVLSGGSMRSVPNTSCAGGYEPTPRVLRLDPEAAVPAWEEIPMTSGAIVGFGAAIATTSQPNRAMRWSGSQDTALPGAAMASASGLSLGGAALTTAAMSAGTPARFLAAAASVHRDADGQPLQLIAGGATALGPTGACTGSTAGSLDGTDQVFVYDEQAAALGPALTAPHQRVGHAAVVARTGGRDKVFLIGGQHGGAPVWDVDELRP